MSSTAVASDECLINIRRPTAWALTKWRMLTPILRKLGPPRFRRFLAERWPNPHVKEAIRIIDTLEETSRKIYQTKIKALKEGDEDIKHKVQEERDIMSILRELRSHGISVNE